MDNQRLFLFMALGLVLLLIWTQWQEDYGPRSREAPVAERSAEEGEAREAETPGAAPEDEATATPPAGRPDGGEARGAPGAGTARAEPGDGVEAGGPDSVRVTTDLLELEIATAGGDIRSARLLDHTVSVDNRTPFELLQDSEDLLFVAQSGLVGDGMEAPDHTARWRVERAQYSLEEGQARIEVPLRWTSEAGVTIVRRYILERDSYVVRVVHEISNSGNREWRGYQYTQLRRTSDTEGPGFLGAASYTGGVIYSEAEKYEKIDFGDMDESDLSRDIRDGWAAFIQHYFLAAIVPPRETTLRYYTRVNRGEYILGMSSPWLTVAPEEQGRLESRLFIGPKEQDRLDEVAAGLELTVDYGWLTVISKPLFIALDWIHGVVGNWGWSIVLLTLGIKLVFYKLSETSYRSMARMRKLQPEMQRLRERHGDDRQKMNQELMDLYKKEKVNPLGGCLPILVQIPVFIALYWVLLESVELRQAPWILWIDDLSVRDPYYVLPLIMGATMFLQQKLNPAPMDPIQQKVMMALPLVFTVFFMFFPAGLVLYWVTNNSLSILQQWIITRRMEAGEKPGNA